MGLSPRRRPVTDDLHESVQKYLLLNPRASANTVSRHVRGRRSDVLRAFKAVQTVCAEPNLGSPSVPLRSGSERAGTGYPEQFGDSTLPPGRRKIDEDEPPRAYPLALADDSPSPQGVEMPTTAADNARAPAGRLRQRLTLAALVERTTNEVLERLATDGWIEAPSPWLSLETCATYLGIPTETLKDLLHTEPVPHRQVRDARIFHRDEIDRWLESRCPASHDASGTPLTSREGACDGRD